MKVSNLLVAQAFVQPDQFSASLSYREGDLLEALAQSEVFDMIDEQPCNALTPARGIDREQAKRGKKSKEIAWRGGIGRKVADTANDIGIHSHEAFRALQLLQNSSRRVAVRLKAAENGRREEATADECC